MIRVIYEAEPAFPSTDQHPDAVRYLFLHPEKGKLYIDAIGGAPTKIDIDVVLNTHTTPEGTVSDLKAVLISKGILTMDDFKK